MRTRALRNAGIVMVLAAMATWAADPASATEPALRIVPAPAQAGSTVKVFGHGFCGQPSCPEVDIVLAGITVARGQVARDGSFSSTFTIKAAPGQYAVTATQANSGGRLEASTGLLVLPADTRAAAPPPATKTLLPPPPAGTPTSKPPTSTSATTTPQTATSEPPTGSTTASSSPTPPGGTTDGSTVPAQAGGQPTSTETSSSPLPWIVGILAAAAATAGAVFYRRRRDQEG